MNSWTALMMHVVICAITKEYMFSGPIQSLSLDTWLELPLYFKQLKFSDCTEPSCL